MDELYGDFTRLYESSKISGATDIGIPDGPAEDSTQDLLEAHNPKMLKPGSPLKHRLW